MTHGWIGAAALLATLVGCESPTIQQSTTSAKSAPTADADEQQDETVMVAGLPGPPLPADEDPVTDVPRKFTKKDPIKGRRTTAQGGVAANFGAAIRAQFEAFIIAIDAANQLYWPQHDFSYPKSHEEFMKEVVAPALNGNLLPDLPEDEEYIYVPEQGEVGLQIRLIPGSPRSKIPAAEPGKEHIFDPEILAAAGVVIPAPDGGGPNGEELSPDPRERAEQLRQRAEAAAAENAVAPVSEPPAAAEEPQPSYSIRGRAEGLGDQLNSRTQEQLDSLDNGDF
jgi:hypothetical protein